MFRRSWKKRVWSACLLNCSLKGRASAEHMPWQLRLIFFLYVHWLGSVDWACTSIATFSLPDITLVNMVTSSATVLSNHSFMLLFSRTWVIHVFCRRVWFPLNCVWGCNQTIGVSSVELCPPTLCVDYQLPSWILWWSLQRSCPHHVSHPEVNIDRIAWQKWWIQPQLDCFFSIFGLGYMC